MCAGSEPAGLQLEGRSLAGDGLQGGRPLTLNVAVIAADGQQWLHFQRKSSAGDEHCGTIYNRFTFDTLDSSMYIGETFVFSKKTGRGAVSYALGATDASDNRDSVYIMPFTCQAF